jgi:transposase
MELVDERTWHCLEPFFPPPKQRRSRCSGRHPLENRRTLNGILFVLKTGIPWETLPVELGFGSGVTCWRRLREWRKGGTWAKLLPFLLTQMQDAEAYNWSRVHVTRNTSSGRKRKVSQKRRRRLRRTMNPAAFTQEQLVVQKTG